MLDPYQYWVMAGTWSSTFIDDNGFGTRLTTNSILYRVDKTGIYRGTETEMAKETKVTSGNELKEEIAAQQKEDAVASVANEAQNALVAAKSTDLAEKFYAPQEIEELAGAGSENVTAANTLLPRLAILQKLSDQIDKTKVEFIKDAEAGDWCDIAVGEIFKGHVDVIPCHFVTQYIQWKKNRGGFVANLGMSAECIKGLPLNERRQPMLPNGDVIMETATWYCLLHVGADWRRVFLPFSSTGLKVSRKWHTLIKAERLLGKNNQFFTPPLFYRPWRLTVATDSNEQGTWYTPVPSKIEVTKGEIKTYKTIYEEMAEMQDEQRQLLKDCKEFYVDARDNLVVGDMASSEDMNDPANAKLVGGAAIDNTATKM